MEPPPHPYRAPGDPAPYGFVPSGPQQAQLQQPGAAWAGTGGAPSGTGPAAVPVPASAQWPAQLPAQPALWPTATGPAVPAPAMAPPATGSQAFTDVMYQLRWPALVLVPMLVTLPALTNGGLGWFFVFFFIAGIPLVIIDLAVAAGLSQRRAHQAGVKTLPTDVAWLYLAVHVLGLLWALTRTDITDTPEASRSVLQVLGLPWDTGAIGVLALVAWGMSLVALPIVAGASRLQAPTPLPAQPGAPVPYPDTLAAPGTPGAPGAPGTGQWRPGA